MTYSDCPTKTIGAANGVEYAYRELGDGDEPLVLLQHFRGNLDYWDPPLVDALATRRRLVLFDNTGVGGSSGTTSTASSTAPSPRRPGTPAQTSSGPLSG